jgi:hypothetical protein
MRPIFMVSGAAMLFSFALPAADGNASQCPVKTTKEVHGTWKGNDNSTYYITRHGQEIWWLGQSNDGKSWANVFKGTLNGNVIEGKFVDVYGKAVLNGGTSFGNLRLQIVRDEPGTRGAITHIQFQSSSAGFGTRRWSLGC